MCIAASLSCTSSFAISRFSNFQALVCGRSPQDYLHRWWSEGKRDGDEFACIVFCAHLAAAFNQRQERHANRHVRDKHKNKLWLAPTSARCFPGHSIGGQTRKHRDAALALGLAARGARKPPLGSSQRQPLVRPRRALVFLPCACPATEAGDPRAGASVS